MDKFSSRLKSITPREILLVVLCCVATYLLRVRQSYWLTPSWRVDVDRTRYENGQFAQPWEILPSPVVADVESDGVNELLMVTKDPHLQLLKIPIHSQSSKALRYMQLQKEVTLVTGKATPRDRQPKALATGYLEMYQSMLQIRTQVIIVVTADWTVLCFDHDLNLQWQTQLMLVQHSRYYIREISVLVSSHSIQPNDGGMVIIGASLADRHHRQPTIHHDHGRRRENHAHQEDENWQRNSNEEEDEEVEKDWDPVVNHFSMFALSGYNGTIRWHHLPREFNELRTTEEDLFSAHHFKLALRKGLTHAGEQHWTQYSQAILNNLPHHWQQGSDTTLTIARVMKDATSQPDGDESGIKPTLSTLIGLDGSHLPGLQFGGLRPHSPTDHVKNPNAIIAHMHQGIEILDLATGRPLTRLKLTTDSAVTYADVDSNGVIDQVKAHFTLDEDHIDNCMAIVKSGIPPQTLLFNGSICTANNYMDSLSESFFGKTMQVKENLNLAVAPICVQSVAKRSGVVNHLLGASLLQSRRGLDSIFLVSNGRVTSYGLKGHYNWKVDTNAKWNDVKTVFKSKHYFPQQTIDIYHNAFQPGIRATSLKVYGKMDAAVLMGWDYVVMISLVDGHVITDHSLPCQPSAPVVLADFNSDGYNDVIVQCSNGLLGFQLEPSSSYWSTAIIGLCLVAVVLGLTSLCAMEHHLFEDERERRQYVFPDDNQERS